ncbi:aldehyde dehydrogenase family protein [Thermogemmatispora onikobensis]|uniref:aldehyde dehydrogenase family protein n=1 Tax=Thermogemmatispora onikobensis TaxID=732234 RepID=UPI000A05D627|nr:aldehyde dehydrogenase family protein [Thermogemmatispora onikobensis]
MTLAESNVAVLPEVQTFIGSGPKKLFIGGRWEEAASGKTFPVYNPATGEVLAQVAEGDKEDIERAVQAARRSFESGPWRKMKPSERGRLIWKLADLIEQHSEEFAQLESLDNGKPLRIARIGDVALTVDMFRYVNGPRLKPGACPQPCRPGLQGWLTAAHCPAGQYSDHGYSERH